MGDSRLSVATSLTMASFAAQSALRAKWSSLVEEHSIEVPPEVTSKVTSVVGWLKQVPDLFIIIQEERRRNH